MTDNYNESVIKVAPPRKKEIRVIRILICAAVILMVLFIAWFFNREHVGQPVIYSLLTFALIFKLVKMLHEWYHYWSVSVPVPPVIRRNWTVDVLTTACPGEPREMIIRTLQKMVAIRYPHTNYLCDEGNDPELKRVCDELGVIHVTRINKIDAKAGNINNALKQATGEICVVLDPDHEPIPEFIDRVIPYFEDPHIGFVQSVQAYYNQSESFIARGAAEQTYHFYGPMMMCMNTYGTVQAIGANCAFRREALDSIGGHAAGLSEDMHTAMQLHAKGWKSVYIPEILTRGLAPATLSSYYKQQLKWSRGTFELLFRTYPALFKKFTLRQKIHYFTIPLYFLFGLINLIDLAIPMLALALAEVPWSVSLDKFALYFFPLCGLSLVIRMYAQRWLLEKHERGFHFAGGLLRTATWWIFLVGFVYTILNIKVPYIPTPKEDEHQNYWKLSIPNVITCLLSLFVISYGLSIDWTPYSFAMASFALLNAGMLGYVVIISQQKLIETAALNVKKIPVLDYAVQAGQTLLARTGSMVYQFMKIGPVAIVLASSLLFFSYSNIDEDNELSNSARPKDLGGFYLGIHGATTPVAQVLAPGPRVTSTDQVLDTSVSILNNVDVSSGNVVPLINWLLRSADSSAVYAKIAEGSFDKYLAKCANDLRKFSRPVFLNFAPGFDDALNQWYVTAEKANEYVKAWQHVYTFFNELGVSNVTWVWSPKHFSSATYYPGPKFVDWLGVSCLNYGDSPKDNDWYEFSELYLPFQKSFGRFEKPVMVYEFGCASHNSAGEWYADAFKKISSYKEINSVILYNSKKTFGVEGKPEYYVADFKIPVNQIAAIIKKESAKDRFKPMAAAASWLNAASAKQYRSPFIKGSAGSYSLVVNSKPYYIRGIAYNTAHDWRDGNLPLTRKQVEKDFEKIIAMGANTIRRYDHGVYDRNVLNIADEYGLKVMYGFWFDPKVDFYADSLRVKKYMADVEEKVLQFKDHPSVLCWSLGNETWGLLKHRYAKPYLTLVRKSYVKMIESLAERIHEIDPTHPVFSCMEHEEYQVAGELVAFRDGAPSVDIIGVNSYYKEQISKLNHLAWEFDSLRPYVISEFGPRGYWDPKYNRVKAGSLVEDSDSEKARWYVDQWNNYVYAHKGYNVGGFAYCWHDRMEGSNTWFGLTDFKGRPKAAYFALKEAWSLKKESAPAEFTITGPASFAGGDKCTFTANAVRPVEHSFKFEWYLHKDEYLSRVDDIELLDDGRKVMVTIPQNPSDYRLYLYVTDEQNRVSTASVPIKVK